MNENIYEELYTVEDNHWWFVARRKIIKRVLQKYQNLQSPNKILEIGCGTGGNLNLLATFGTVNAIENNSNARQLASQRNICEIKAGMLPDQIPYTDKHDLICLLDVLEHIEDDRGALKSLLNLLTPNGTVLITVPAYNFLWSDHDVAHHHKRRYTRKQLIQLVEQSSLKVKYCSYFNSLFFPLICIIRIMGRLIKNKKPSDVSMPAPLINKLLEAVFSTEKYLIPDYSIPFGVSILLVAKT